MKRLAFLNLAIVICFVGIFYSVAGQFRVGAVSVIVASVVIFAIYLVSVHKLKKAKQLLSIGTVALTFGILVIGEIFLLGYSVAIGHSLLSLPGFYELHVVVGVILMTLFVGFSFFDAWQIENSRMRVMLIAGISIVALMSLLGYLGLARILPNTVRLIYYAFVFLIFFYTLFFLFFRFERSESIISKRVYNFGLLISCLLICHWLVRWQFPDVIPSGVYRVAFSIGFLPIIVLPLSIFAFRKLQFFIAFILYAILLDIFFISYDRDFKYLVDTGIAGCVGYESGERYPIVRDPGTSAADLLRAPSQEEIANVYNEWKHKDFTAQQLHTEFEERKPNGDSIKVISHLINGRKHYGLLRIPAGLDVKNAPILLALNGGGSDIDVLDSEFITRIAPYSCREVLDRYLVIAPSFRGDVVRGNGFCFRSEGYTGDVWAGAAEDAAYFLEAVNTLYKRDDSMVLAVGISRGATVAMILGGLTNKIDRIVAISTHTNFFNDKSFYQERVSSDYPAVFFTPAASPDEIRKRMLVSSPFYFAEHLPYFEIHQGTEDPLTTVQHTKLLEQRLQEINRSDSTYRIYYYEGKGHGFDDDRIVCTSLVP